MPPFNHSLAGFLCSPLSYFSTLLSSFLLCSFQHSPPEGAGFKAWCSLSSTVTTGRWNCTPQVLLRAGKGKLASFPVSGRVSCCLVMGLFNALKVAQILWSGEGWFSCTFLLASGKVDLQCESVGASLLGWDCTLSKKRPGLSSTAMFNYLQGKGHPRSQDDLFPPPVVGVCGPSSLPLGFQKTGSFYINLGSLCFVHIVRICSLRLSRSVTVLRRLKRLI